MKKLTVAVIGLSGMGRSHLDAAIKYGAQIGAICDINEETLKLAGDKFGIPEEKRFTDHMDIVSDPAVDAVIIVTPDQLHREMCERFLAAGKHVLCEKPLALTRADMSAIIAAAQKSGRKCMVGQICRFTPAFAKAKELLDSGAIGELYFVESEYAHDYAPFLQSWRADPLRHGVIGGGCHAIDLLRWYAGDPEEVFAYGTHKLLPQVSYDDATISVLKFPNGVIGKVFVSTGCKRPYTMRTLLYGTKGTVICDNTSDHMELYTVGEDGVNIKKEPEIIRLEIKNHNACREFEVFADALLYGATLEMTALEGAKSVEVGLSIVESSKTGSPVRPNYTF